MGFLAEIFKAIGSLGFRNVAEGLFLTRFKWFWSLVQSVGFLRSFFNKWMINNLIYKIPTRPNPLSTETPYTSWSSLTDTRWSSRHLPPVVRNNPPPSERVAELFRRPAGPMTKFGKSSLLFPTFAQWFTDGFLRTDYFNVLKNTSNHDIDLSNLYGLTPDSTNVLRSHTDGKLRSQFIGDEEYPPFFHKDGKVDPDYQALPMARLLELLDHVAGPIDNLPPQFRSRALLFSGFREVLGRKPLDSLMFAMGGDRINSNAGFVAMNVLFLREHNRICEVLKQKTSIRDDEQLFQTARNILIVLLIKIVLEEYINHITPYQFKLFTEPGAFEDQIWYRQNRMAIEFNLLYRWHGLTTNAYVIGGREFPLVETLFNNRLVTERGLGGFLEDASKQVAGRVGVLNTPDVLVPVEQGSIDLGREARLASYNDYRELCQIKRATSFEQITRDPEAQGILKDLYGNVDKVEYFPGIFAEDVVPNSVLPFLIGRLVSVDAFSQALTNPLLSAHVFKEDTFTRVGVEIITTTRTLSEIVHRNIPAGQGPFHISMERDKAVEVG